MTRGEIYYVKTNKLEDGCKPCPDKPAVIVSSDMLNAISNTVQVCYLTTNPWQDMATHVTTRSLDGNTVSTILCEQIFTLNKMRLGNRAGELSEGELRNVDMALAISLGLDFEAPAQEPREIVKTVEVEKVVMREPTEEELDKLIEARAKAKEREKQLESFTESLREIAHCEISKALKIPRTMLDSDDVKALGKPAGIMCAGPMDASIDPPTYITEVETERDIYRRLYEDILDRLTAIAAGVKA